MRDFLIRSCISLTPQSLSHWLVGDFVPVFLVHRVVDSNFEPDVSKINRIRRYLEYIRKYRYQPLSLPQLFYCLANNEPLPQRAVIFTVDDGFVDQFEYLSPIFIEYDVPLTCFVITDFLDGKLWPWDDQVAYVINGTNKSFFTIGLPDGELFSCSPELNGRGNVIDSLRAKLKSKDQTNIYGWLSGFYSAAEVESPEQPPLYYQAGSWVQANEFVRSGHSIAAHTRTHRILSQLSDIEAEDEIIGSYQHLKAQVPDSSDIFAFPTGRVADFGEREKQIIADSPMLGAVSTVPDAIRFGYDIEALPRFGLPRCTGDFLQYLSFIEALKSKVRAAGVG
ncbi:MAG: polysaccharide deacetylase family protein [Gammaproteobacteria bacterium]|nr:polysaccharide deacetylase family protein [Gammaproteobacteria bacterium]